MEAIFSDIYPKKREIPLDTRIVQPILDVMEPDRYTGIAPFIPMPVIPQPYPADEDLPLDISVPKAVPGGLKLWHLLVAVGVLFLVKKR